ncbi:sugar MFS transporter [Pedobacter sp. MC2016-15]|uniref:sugar MFS transporter n=1 Tax=Pedobacter sp. MC2016-15 TaxID=2994473 RepID=UPI002247E0DD|nr:sugar MFS transporter [Pedobacter sp. MC2016-15]MCX2479723.1 sugar MFS transporter [Pedobacter sp. MC2016-15]
MDKKAYTQSLLIIAILFFVFGFVTWINAMLIPYFKICCELSNLESYFVAFAFYISYLFMSFPASLLLKRVGFKKGMMLGFWIMAFGAFLFVPAALLRNYPVFLLGLFTLGAGLAILQTAANPYVTILGPKESAAMRFSIMGICNKFAGIIAPLLFAAVVLKSSDQALFEQVKSMGAAERAPILDELIRRVILPYSCVSVILILLGILVRFSPLPEIDTDLEDSLTAAANKDKDNIFQFPHLILGALAIFVHVGSQVIAVDTIIGYARSMDISLLESKVFPSYTLGATIIGYLLGISLIPKYISQIFALRVCVCIGLLLTFCIIFSHGSLNILGHQADISLWFIVLLGFANSMIWAGIWPLAMDRLGRFIKVGAAILIMGLSGNAVLPLVYGHLADTYGLQQAYWVLLPCYLYLLFYAYRGYRLNRWVSSKPFRTTDANLKLL